MKRGQDDRVFCRTYLQTMDPDRAAGAAGRQDGFTLLGRKGIQEQLEQMRSNAAGQLRREDALRRLAQIAFGRAGAAGAETGDGESGGNGSVSALGIEGDG